MLAAVTLPTFKLRWILDEDKKDHTKMLLAAECRALPAGEAPLEPPLPAPVAGGRDGDDFFVFDDGLGDTETTVSVDSEIAEYLTSKDMQMDVLNKFPRVKKISLRLNTATPSSAPVERLFSLGSLVLTPKRNRLSDKRFEKRVLLRYNHFFGIYE